MLRAHLRRLHTAERGSLALFWVLGLLGFASLLAVVADGGAALATRRELQNAADAAALAGAQSLVLGSPTAIADAQLWAQKNATNLSVNQASTSGQVSGGTPSQIDVTLERDATGLFNETLGLGRPTVRAQATARMASLALPGPGVAPIGIPAVTFFLPEAQQGGPLTLVFTPPGQGPLPGCGLVDVVLVLDVSFSIDDTEFDALKQAAQALVDLFALDADNGVLMGVRRFRWTSASVQTMTDNAAALHAGIDGLSRVGVGSGTNILAAVTGGTAQFSTGVADRPAPNVMIVITDGNDTEGNSNSQIAAASTASGAQVFAVGVGSSVSQSTLDAIAYPDSGHVFTTATFTPCLIGLVDEIAAGACSVGAGTTSNSGLLDIDGGGANTLRDALIYGSVNPLDPIENTEPGQNIGPMLDGLRTRLQAALQNGCFTWDQVTQSAAVSPWTCGPLQAGAADPAGVQATSVIMVPVTVEDFLDEQGTETVHISQTSGGPYLTAMIWVDALATFTDPLSGDWSCASGPPASCVVRGRIIVGAPSALGTAGPTDVLVDYDPLGAVRVVQLID